MAFFPRSLIGGLAALAFLLTASRAEDKTGVPPAQAERIAQALRLADRNGDGAIDAQERDAFLKTLAGRGRLKETAERVLQQLDRNGDGKIDKKELSAVEKAAGKADGQSGTAQKQTFMVEMRDGKKLATDVYLPQGAGPFPVLLTRTPYNKNGNHAKPGYAVVVQDMRGRFASEGENIPFVGCGWEPYQDGADTVAWIRKQPWCDGKIGTVGGSACGITQNLMAGAAPEGLTAQYIQVAAASLYHQAAYVGGALRKEQAENWTKQNGFETEVFKLWNQHAAYDEYWHKYDSTRKTGVMNVPAVHSGGWFDTFAQGTLDSFVTRQTQGAPGAKGTQKLVMGPWVHGLHVDGELKFPNAGFPHAYDRERWFAHYLQGKENGVEKEPAVCYYVMGDVRDPKAPGNAWRQADTWPVPAQETPFYLLADGMLSKAKPEAAPEGQPPRARTFTFDPADPYPTLGGRNLTLAPRGPMNQNKLEARKDALLFTSAPLDAPLEVTGRVQAAIWVSSSAKDTDLAVFLCDVYPDGKSYPMAVGHLRLRYRESLSQPKPLEPNQPCEVMVDCWSTSVVFNTGHRVRVVVSSSNYPHFDLNPGTGEIWKDGGAFVKQTNTIFCDAQHSSRVLLPAVPAGK